MNPITSKNITLENAKSSKLSTQVRLNFLTENIVNSGWTRYDCVKYVKEEWGLADRQAERYYYSALHNLMPDDPEKYREGLIQRNIDRLELLFKKALDANNLKAANQSIKILNSMLGVGGKSIEIKDKDGGGNDRTFIISFGD